MSQTSSPNLCGDWFRRFVQVLRDGIHSIRIGDNSRILCFLRLCLLRFWLQIQFQRKPPTMDEQIGFVELSPLVYRVVRAFPSFERCAMFRKAQDVQLTTKTSIRKKEVKELRQRIKYALANYTEDMDGTLFGNGSVGVSL